MAGHPSAVHRLFMELHGGTPDEKGKMPTPRSHVPNSQLSAAGRSHGDFRSRFAPHQDPILRADSQVVDPGNLQIIQCNPCPKNSSQPVAEGFLKLDMHT